MHFHRFQACYNYMSWNTCGILTYSPCPQSFAFAETNPTEFERGQQTLAVNFSGCWQCCWQLALPFFNCPNMRFVYAQGQHGPRLPYRAANGLLRPRRPARPPRVHGVRDAGLQPAVRDQALQLPWHPHSGCEEHGTPDVPGVGLPAPRLQVRSLILNAAVLRHFPPFITVDNRVHTYTYIIVKFILRVDS